MSETDATILQTEDIQAIDPDLEVLPLLPKNLAQKTQTLVFAQEGNRVSVLTTNNYPALYRQMIDKLKAMDYKINAHYTDTASFEQALNRYHALEEQQESAASEYEFRHSATGEEAIKLIKDAYKNKGDYTEGNFLNEILRLSYQAGASDVHFQTEEMGVVMRLRKDGILKTILVFTHKEFKKYLMKLKFMAGVKMNIEEQSQDGRFDFDIKHHEEVTKIDVRVSVMPSLRGESIVLRFLDATKGMMTLEEIGAQPFHIDTIKEHLGQNSGLVLVTGPTGSGKTTTVYSLLNYLNTPHKKIISLEDPVEYELPGIEQSQINEKKGYTFEAALKGVLRHDPDIIMVGEIRTLTSAKMAINAALTGHLVISTLHTNSAVEAVNRMLNMGVQPFMLAGALELVIAQRLVRRLAKSLSKEPTPAVDQLITSTISTVQQHHPQVSTDYTGQIATPVEKEGVFGSGYEGRIAIMETFDINATIKQAVLDGASTNKLFSLAQQAGYLTMEQDGLLKVADGITSLAEVLQATGTSVDEMAK